MDVFESSVMIFCDSVGAFESRGVDFGQLGRCIWVRWCVRLVSSS